MYNPELVRPMREELTRHGVIEMQTPTEVDELLGDKQGTVLLVINSVCGCAAGAARPGVTLALKNSKLPERLTTVFAGQDKDATDRARSYLLGLPPSSPSVALLKDGKVVHMLHRQNIEGRSAEEIAKDLKDAFNTYC